MKMAMEMIVVFENYWIASDVSWLEVILIKFQLEVAQVGGLAVG